MLKLFISLTRNSSLIFWNRSLDCELCRQLVRFEMAGQRTLIAELDLLSKFFQKEGFAGLVWYSLYLVSSFTRVAIARGTMLQSRSSF